MTSEELLEKLKKAYSSSFDMTDFYELGQEKYDAYGAFNVTSAKYVLSKKAELWRANCFEHVFFKCTEQLTVADLETFQKQIVDYMEPDLVRRGAKWPPENHMYTFLTGIYLVDRTVSDEVKVAVKKFKYIKNYKLTIRGYCEARFLVFDMEKKEIFGNRASRDLVKGYEKIF